MADRISTLPDDALCHILSFRPTQTAIATSVLSKRWRPLWLSVSTLFFDDRSYLINNRTYDGFSKFIYRTMLTRNLHHQPITSFRLQCGSSHFNLSDSDLNIWVNAAVQGDGLENLHINLPSTIAILTLKSCIFSCKTLVVLKLIGLELDAFSFVHLPALKTLHLVEVHFPKPQFLMELLCGCPMLEYMHLRDITVSYDDDSTPSNVKLNSLTKLVKADISYIESIIPLKVICNVEFLRIDEYLDDIPVFPNLTHVELMFSTGMNWHLVLAMLKKCPKLQKLSLDMLASSTDMVWISPFNVPECLSSQLQKCSITNYKGTKSEQHFASYIMQNSGVLRTMTISTVASSKLQDKFEMIKELSLCRRSSTICELSFR